MLTVGQIREPVERLGKKYGIKNAYLFGSYARGEADENSDVDLIVDGGEIRTMFELSSFRFELMEELGGIDIDVITTDGVKPKFFNLIKNDRMLIYRIWGCVFCWKR